MKNSFEYRFARQCKMRNHRCTYSEFGRKERRPHTCSRLVSWFAAYELEQNEPPLCPLKHVF